jgi:hypothetical protein
MRGHLKKLANVGVDQVTFIKQADMNKLASYIEAALARKKFMPMPEDKSVPVFLALGRSIIEGEKDPKKRLRSSSAAVSLDRFQFSADFEPFAFHNF